VSVVWMDGVLGDMSRVVVGLDLSLTHTGVGVVSESGQKICFEIVPKRTGFGRTIWIRDTITDRLQEFERVTAFAIEGYSFGSVGRSIYDIGELGGLVKAKFYEEGSAVWLVPPSVVKKFATGKGNATKEMVVDALNAMRGWCEWSEFGAPFEYKRNNEVDALFLALILSYKTFKSSRPISLSQLSRERQDMIAELESKCSILTM